MKQRRNLDREGLEVYLLNLFLAYRPLLQISGLLLLVYAILALTTTVIVGSVALVAAIFLVILANSYQAIQYMAKIGAWVGTIRVKNQKP